MTDYKKYSLNQLENWVHDALNADIPPQEIFDTIKGVVLEQYHYHKNAVHNTNVLLALLNGNGEGQVTCTKDKEPEKSKNTWPDFWKCDDPKFYSDYFPVKWVLEVDVDGMIVLPPELLAKVGWVEGDLLEFYDNNDGSFKVSKKED